MAHCPECEAVVDVDEDEIEEGEVLSCPECGVDLEVVNTNPLELDLLDEEGDEEEDEESIDEEDEDSDDSDLEYDEDEDLEDEEE